MKIPICLAALLMHGIFISSADAQSSVTRRTTQSPGPRGYFLPTNTLPAKSMGPAKSVAPATPAMLIDPKAAKTPTIVVVPEAPPPTPEELARREQKKLEFQRKQAEEGRDFAQYELGMRYLKGDGVTANPEEARKWIALAAEQNYTLAVRKLAELDKAAGK